MVQVLVPGDECVENLSIQRDLERVQAKDTLELDPDLFHGAGRPDRLLVREHLTKGLGRLFHQVLELTSLELHL